MGNSVVVTPLDQFNSWRRDGERKLAELTSYREQAQKRFDDARGELAAIDAAIGELNQLLNTPQAAHEKAVLQALLLEAAGDFADTHPIQARIREALKLGAGPG